jgi:hypothetical protein
MAASGLKRAAVREQTQRERLPRKLAEQEWLPWQLPKGPPRWLVEGLAELERQYFPHGGRLSASRVEAWRQHWLETARETRRKRRTANASVVQTSLTATQRQQRDRIIELAAQTFVDFDRLRPRSRATSSLRVMVSRSSPVVRFTADLLDLLGVPPVAPDTIEKKLGEAGFRSKPMAKPLL